MPTPLTEQLMGSPLVERAMDLAPRAGWVLGVELVRGALLLLVVAVAIRAAGGVRGRYRILSAGIVLALLLPLAAVSPGVWRVGVPFEMQRSSAVEPSASELAMPGAAADEAAVDRVARRGSVVPGEPARVRETQPTATPLTSRVISIEPLAVTRSEAVSVAGTSIEPAASAAPAQEWSVMGYTLSDARRAGDRAAGWLDAAASQPLTWIGLWAVGALAVLTWGMVGVLRLAVIAQGAEAADDRWVIEAERVMRRLKIRRSVRVVVSGAVPVPMTWGVWRPIVVVPAAGNAWDAERRRVVLTHELVHVRRLDWALQVAAWVVVSLHWCNPLAWWAVRRLAVERERSCDAAVVACGTRPSAYASHLLDIARAMSDVRSPVHALGMAKASELEGRLMSILNGTRRGAKRSVGAAVLVMFAGLAAAAVAPQAIPPEKQAELDRREAELAKLEAELAAKRAALDKARVEAEVAEVDERNRAEVRAIGATDRAPEPPRAVTVRGEPAPRGAVRVREPRPARVAGVVSATGPTRVRTATGEPARVRGPEGVSVDVIAPVIAVGEASPESGRVIVFEGEIGPESNGPLEKWRVLAKDKDALRARLRSIEPVDAPELGKEMQILEKLQIELERRSQKLQGVAEKLQPIQAELEGRQHQLEPYQEKLEQLSRRMQAEMEAVQAQAEQLEQGEGLQELELDLHQHELQLRDQLAAVGEQIKQAAQQGDMEKLRQYEKQVTELVRQRDQFASKALAHASEVRASTEQAVAKIHQHRQEVVEKYQRQMEDLHAEMERVHEAMGESHHGMEGVHEKMEEIHQRIQERVAERVGQLIRESLEAEGLSTDNPKAKTVIGLTRDQFGSRMIIEGPDGDELLHIIDPGKTFDRMRKAIAAAQDSGELQLSDSAREKLERALKRAADRSEVIRFKVPGVKVRSGGGSGGGSGDGWSDGASSGGAGAAGFGPAHTHGDGHATAVGHAADEAVAASAYRTYVESVKDDRK